MRTTMNLDDALMARAQELVGPMDRTALVHAAHLMGAVAECGPVPSLSCRMSRVAALSPLPNDHRRHFGMGRTFATTNRRADLAAAEQWCPDAPVRAR